MSLRILDAAGVTAPSAVIDVGGGTSRLTDALLARGSMSRCWTSPVLPSGSPVNASWADADRGALGHRRCRHLVAGRPYDAWHDRAVLHFLTSEVGQTRYLGTLEAATRPGAVAVFGCFVPDGPARCSGLPVVRRSAADLTALVGPGWVLTAEDRELHPTPGGGAQPFTWAAFIR